MKRIKRIFVASIILLLSITPVLATVEVKENTQISTVSTIGNNSYSLGVLTVEHQPFTNHFFKYKGATMSYQRPDILTFQFPEINGSVWMNFTITVTHRLNIPPVPYFILPRYTLVDRLYLNYDGQDYFNIFNEILCESEAQTNYTIYLTPDKQVKSLPTHGQPVTVQFYLNAGVDAGKFNIPLTDGTLWRFGRYWSNRNADIFDITIVPI